MLDAFTDPLWQRVAESLLHFVWQGALIAAVLAAVLRICRTQNPQHRYVLTLVAMSAMAVCPVITFLTIEPETSNLSAQHAQNQVTQIHQPSTARTTDRVSEGVEVGPTSDHETGHPIVENQPVATAVSSWRTTLTRYSPWIVAIWLTGGVLFAFRLLIGAGALAWMTRLRQPVPEPVAAMLSSLCKRMSLRRPPVLRACDRCAEAMAMGWLKPVILIPTSWVSQVQPEILEAVLAHELAHIRRRDIWVNLLQRILETILFYHPAVWWISNRLRTEREFCCDELAVAATGRRAGYAEALEWVARSSAIRKSPVLAMTIGGKKMALLNRVRNILKSPAEPRQGGWLAAGFATLLIPALLWCALLGWNPLSAEDNVEGERGEREQAEREELGERRERAEREKRGEKRERGEREERREGAERRERGERERGERERGERERREREERGEKRRDGDRPRDGERRRDGERGERRPDRDRPREVERRGPGGEIRELLNALRQLRAEVAQLRKEVNELKGGRAIPGPRNRRIEDDFRRRAEELRRNRRRPDGDRPDARRRDGDKPKERRGEVDRPKRESDRPRGEREREGEKRDRPREKEEE